MKVQLLHDDSCPFGSDGLRLYSEARDALAGTPPEARATIEDRANLAQAEFELDQKQVCACGYPTDEKKLADLIARMMASAAGINSVDEVDEGEVKLLVSSNEELLRIDFGKRITWIALPKNTAVEFAAVILQHCGAHVERRFIANTPATPGAPANDQGGSSDKP